MTADTCKPPLCEKAEAPTYGKLLLGFLFKSSSNNLEHSVKELNFFLLTFISNFSANVFFKVKVGMIDIKFAFPHLSPKPLIVP